MFNRDPLTIQHSIARELVSLTIVHDIVQAHTGYLARKSKACSWSVMSLAMRNADHARHDARAAATPKFRHQRHYVEGRLGEEYSAAFIEVARDNIYKVDQPVTNGTVSLGLYSEPPMTNRQGQAVGSIRDGDPQLLVAFFFGVFVQYFKDTRVSRQTWNTANSQIIRDLCWKSIAKSG